MNEQQEKEERSIRSNSVALNNMIKKAEKKYNTNVREQVIEYLTEQNNN